MSTLNKFIIYNRIIIWKYLTRWLRSLDSKFCGINSYRFSYTRNNHTFAFTFSEPPSPPLISGLPQNQTLREGQALSLTCSTTDGSPQPRLAWYMDDSLKELSHANLTLNPFSQSQLRLVASRQDNNREYRYV